MATRSQVDVSPGGGWLTVHEASQLLGVSSATLRRWSQAGQVEAFVTPGGHRRFARAAILALLPGRTGRRTLKELGQTPERTVRRYRTELAHTQAHGGWVTHMPEERREAYRDLGRRILAGVIAFLDAPTTEAAEASIGEAAGAAAEYGRLAATLDLGPAETTRIFQRLRAPFLHELGGIARRRGLEIDEATTLVHAATLAFDRLLVALLDGYGGPNAAETGAEAADVHAHVAGPSPEQRP